MVNKRIEKGNGDEDKKEESGGVMEYTTKRVEMLCEGKATCCRQVMNSTLVRLAASQLPGGGDCSSLNTQ